MLTENVGGIPSLITSSGTGTNCDGVGGIGGMGFWGFLILAILFGGNGGLFGSNRNGAGVAAVDNTVWTSQNFSRLESGQNSIQSQLTGVSNGVCSSTYELNNSIKDGNYNNTIGLQSVNTNLGNAICSSTYSLNNSIKDGTNATITGIQTLGNNTERAITSSTYALGEKIGALSSQVAACCCETQKGLCEVNFNAERNTNAVIQAGNANTQRLIDYMTNKDLCDKNEKLFAASQRAQTLEIIGAMKPQAPVPAYPVPSPYGSYGNLCSGTSF